MSPKKIEYLIVTVKNDEVESVMSKDASIAELNFQGNDFDMDILPELGKNGWIMASSEKSESDKFARKYYFQREGSVAVWQNL